MSASTQPKDELERWVVRWNPSAKANLDLYIACGAVNFRDNWFDWGIVKEWKGGDDEQCEPSEEFVKIQLENYDKELSLQGQGAKTAREMMGEEEGENGKPVVNAKKAVWGHKLKVYVFSVGGNISEVRSEQQVVDSYGQPIDKWWNESKELLFLDYKPKAKNPVHEVSSGLVERMLKGLSG